MLLGILLDWSRCCLKRLGLREGSILKRNCMECFRFGAPSILFVSIMPVIPGSQDPEPI